MRFWLWPMVWVWSAGLASSTTFAPLSAALVFVANRAPRRTGPDHSHIPLAPITTHEPPPPNHVQGNGGACREAAMWGYTPMK